jgi:nucleotide-binding universal stress UspA family protein
MYRNILVPLDGSPLAEAALTEAVKLAKMTGGSKLTLLTVVKLPSVLFADGMEGIDVVRFQKSRFDRARSYLAAIESKTEKEGVSVASDVIEGSASEAIVEYSLRHGIDIIVIATHGYTGMKKLMLGSVALSVLHNSHVPVLLIRPATSRK